VTTMKVAATLACLALLIVVQCGSLVHAASLELDSTAKGATTTATLKFTPTQNFNGSSTAGITIPIAGMALGTNATETTAGAGATTTHAGTTHDTTHAGTTHDTTHAATTTAPPPPDTTTRRLLAASACTVLPSSIGGTCAVSYASGVLTINLLSGSYTTTVPVSISISNFVVPTTAIPAISLTVLSNVNSAASAIFTVVVQVPVLTTPGPYFKPLSSASIGFINCVCVAIVFAISAMSIL
jgi:hypothetical protein